VAVATGLNETELVERIGDCDGIIVRSKTRVTAAVVSAGHQRLKVIGRVGIGVDNIDVAAATECGIVVLNTPDANATTTAELALAKIAEDMAAFLTTVEAPSAVNLPRISAEQLVRTRAYQHLAHALGGFIAAMVPDPITEIEVGLFGRSAGARSSPNYVTSPCWSA
jgi:hypothetical protein